MAKKKQPTINACPEKCNRKFWKDDTPKPVPGLTGLQIKTTCSKCGKWIGFRPAKEQ